MHLEENLSNEKYLSFVERMNREDPEYFEKFEVTSVYEAHTKNIQVHHIECGAVLSQRPMNIMSNGARCMSCHKKAEGIRRQKKAGIDFRAKFEKKFDYAGEYTFLSNYETVHKKITVRHECGNEYLVTPNKLLSGKRCPECMGGVAISHDEFIRRCEEKLPHFHEYEILNTYAGKNVRLRIRHNCGHEYEVRAFNFSSNMTLCPKCSTIQNKESAPAKKIREFLESAGIEFEMEKTLAGCESDKGVLLPFDFFIPSLKLVIEYDGEQHFSGTRFKSESISHERRMMLDDRKTIFIIDETDYSFLRIPSFLKRYVEDIMVEIVQTKKDEPDLRVVLAYFHDQITQKLKDEWKGDISEINFPISSFL